MKIIRQINNLRTKFNITEDKFLDYYKSDLRLYIFKKSVKNCLENMKDMQFSKNLIDSIIKIIIEKKYDRQKISGNKN